MELLLDGLAITWREIDGGAEIVRVWPPLRRVELPETIEGRRVVALAARAFSPRGDEEMAAARSLRAVSLPRYLERVGDYAFYNCTELQALELYDTTQHWGVGCLMNCRALGRIELKACAPHSTALYYFAQELSRELDVSVYDAGGDLRLIFPEFSEDYENNDPAHHFDFRLYGAGYPYHEAFWEKELSLSLFDGAWSGMLRRGHDENCALRLAWYRLRFPRGLAPAAEKQYRTYLSDRCGALLLWALRAGREELKAALTAFPPQRENLTAALESARREGMHEQVALLLDEQHRRFGASVRKSFDL